jgi:hypothetical protein
VFLFHTHIKIKSAARGSGMEEILITSNMLFSTPDLFQIKSQTGQDLYRLLLGALNRIGPVRETKKEMSISLENRKAFASVMIRNRSIKLVLRTNHKIASPRIHSMEHVADKGFDHTILIESKDDIDEELMKWLGDAYQTSK